MSFKFDFDKTPLSEYIGKEIEITFTDDSKMRGVVLGFVSATDDEKGETSIDVIADNIEGIVHIAEAEDRQSELEDMIDELESKLPEDEESSEYLEMSAELDNLREELDDIEDQIDNLEDEIAEREDSKEEDN